MRFNCSVFTYFTMLMLVFIGTVGTAFSGTEDTVIALSPAPSFPTGVAADSSGNIYIADTGNNKVIITGVTPLTIGTGTAGFMPTSGYPGLNTTVGDTTIQFNSPSGVTVDVNGNLYIADTGNHRVHMIIADTNTTTKLKEITAASKIVTIAGSGVEGFSGDGALANIASLNRPTGVAVDSIGIVYIADNGNYRIRKVTAAKITVVGTVTPVTTITYGTISTVAGDGKATTLTAYGIAISPAPVGDLFIADSGNNRILKLTAAAITAKGLPVAIAGTGTAGFFGDGGLATLAQLNQPSGVATDGKDLYIADTMNHCVRKIPLSTGIISTRVGTALQTAAVVPVAPVLSLSFPMGIGVSAAGTVYVADTGNNIVDQVYASVSSITTASPPGGTYATAQTITLTASKAAIISYKINSGASTPYTGPFTISGPATTVLTFTSLDVASHQEVTNISTYVFDTTAPTSTSVINATPVNGTFYSAQSALTVTLASTQSSTIYYTTTGVVPTAISTNIYSLPFFIPVTNSLTTTNVQFFSIDAAGNKEVVQSQKYITVAINTTASPAGGAYRSVQTVTLASNDSSAAIYYTIDGSDPTAASPQYNPATRITISTNTILKFRAKDSNANLEQTKTQIYAIDSIAPLTSASPVGTSYSTPQTITLTPDDLNASIYYTTTGIAPTTSSAKYTVPLIISTTTTLMYFAIDTAGNKEAVRTEVYTIDAIAPITTATVLSGTYASIQSVALTTNDSNASIYFTTDGTTPTVLSTKYSIPVVIDHSAKLQYFSVDIAGNKESIKEQNYTIIKLTSSASPKGGVFNTPQTVILTSNGVGSSIYYTMDGTDPVVTILTQYPVLTIKSLDPNESTKKYTNSISLKMLMQDPAVTIKFFAIDEKGVIENVKKVETYSVDYLPPTTIATCGTIANTIKLVASDAIDLLPKIKYIANTVTNSGAIAAYTLADYTAPITFTNNTIIKFFSTDVAGNTEQIKTAYCADVVAPLDMNPALYLETLPNAVTTSNSTVFMRGNVAPFATANLDINGTVVTTNSTDGSFSYLITTPTLVAGPNIITTTVTDGILSTPDTRTINFVAPGPTPTLVTIGSSNGVIGHSVRIPITFTSGHQAAAVSVDIAYDPAAYNPVTSRLTNPKVEITKEAAALGKIISGGSPSVGVYRILIMDNPANSGALMPLPDGVLAYLSFSIPFTPMPGNEPLNILAYSATDLEANELTVLAGVSGNVNVVSSPGFNLGSTTGNVPVTLKDVQDVFYMLLDPITHPADGSADLNADGRVQIYELQQVVNSFLGL